MDYATAVLWETLLTNDRPPFDTTENQSRTMHYFGPFLWGFPRVSCGPFPPLFFPLSAWIAVCLSPHFNHQRTSEHIYYDYIHLFAQHIILFLSFICPPPGLLIQRRPYSYLFLDILFPYGIYHAILYITRPVD